MQYFGLIKKNKVNKGIILLIFQVMIGWSILIKWYFTEHTKPLGVFFVKHK